MTRTIPLIMGQIQMYQTVIQTCMTFQTHRLETNANQIMMTDQSIMKAHRAKNASESNANIARLLFPIWDSGKFKAISASSIPIMGLPHVRPTFCLGPSMARGIVSPRKEQFCNK